MCVPSKQTFNHSSLLTSCCRRCAAVPQMSAPPATHEMVKAEVPQMQPVQLDVSNLKVCCGLSLRHVKVDGF